MSRIARFSKVYDVAAVAVGELADTLRALQDQGGHLSLRRLNVSLHDKLGAAKAAITDVFVEVAKDPVKADEEILDFSGGPESVAELQAGVANIQSKTDAFNAALEVELNKLSFSDLYEFKQVGSPGKEYTRHILRAHLTDELAAPIRALPELTELIDAVEAVGG
ncbi:hypothetical protein [uncultured Ruegeria sp.]|uniref:hypothetical protein n=1 Tax=uncultured Ruegeria sp. TaxID=259304 RepID=UPI0026036779|nr:hypothetical protein [uncultured Ruegeria sp.]